MLRHAQLFLISIFFSFSLEAQWCFNNPSMEGPSAPHVVPAPWQTCFGSPDTQPGQWGITLPASDGNTYTSFLHAGNNQNGYKEGQTQQLTQPFVIGQTYTFNVDLAHSLIYNTASPNGCYSTLAVYGGNAQCAQTQVIWQSGAFTHTNWQTYTITFTATGNWTWVAFAPYHTGTNCGGYINVLMDNLTCITIDGGMQTTDVTCNGACDGTAKMSVTTGTSPYTYNWSNGNTTDSISNLCPGDYYITVTDANNQTILDTATIVEPPALVTTVDSIRNVSCFGSNDGYASLSVNGGTPGYTYLWDVNTNSQTDSFATGLTDGQYYITVTDTNGCEIVDSVTIIEPSILTVVADSTDVDCFGNATGSVAATPAGGTPPYSYLWSNAGTNSTEVNLTAGTYSVTITDDMGCTAISTTTITEPTQLSIAITSQSDVLCNGGTTGSATAAANGGTPNYTYLWSNSVTDTTNNNIPVGNYTVVVTDANGCTASTNVIVNEPELLIATVTPNNVSCEGDCNGTAMATAEGGTPTYQYRWSTGVNDTLNQIIDLCATTYTVTITDDHGCTDITSAKLGFDYPDPIADFTMDPLVATNLDPIVEVYDMSVGADYWHYDIGDGNETNDRNFYHSYQDTGHYVITQSVATIHGCVDTIRKTVQVDYVSTIYIPNAFTPEQKDGINDGFGPEMEGVSTDDYNFTIFDRWGQVLFTSSDLEEKWDGTHIKTGDAVPQGVYVYHLKYKHFNGIKNERRGHVTLIR